MFGSTLISQPWGKGTSPIVCGDMFDDCPNCVWGGYCAMVLFIYPQGMFQVIKEYFTRVFFAVLEETSFASHDCVRPFMIR